MRYAALFLLMGIGPVTAQQQIHRCGNTFSERPCEVQQPAAAPVQPAPEAPPAIDTPTGSDPIEAAKAACVARLKADVAFIDPESVRIGSIERRTLWTTQIGGRMVSARMYVLQVDAKNGHGTYSGEWPFVCNVDPADRAVLNIVPPVACSAETQPSCTYS